MLFLKHLLDIPILIVLITFITSVVYCCRKYTKTAKELDIIYNYIKSFKKNDLNFRIKEIDTWMSSNPYVADIWSEFKNTLVFSESVAIKSGEENLNYQNVSKTVQNVQTTTDPLYFFNEESLITGKFNYKLIQTMPTVLTGFGPLFTFLNIAIAFGKIDFSSQDKTLASVSGFMISMQSAALVSVVAVSSSLIYLIIERIMYNTCCKSRLNKIQVILGNLFASISAEKFLYELLRVSKIQNSNSSNIMQAIPEKFETAFNTSVATSLVPYLENLIFGLNQLNKQLKESIEKQKAEDIVDELF